MKSPWAKLTTRMTPKMRARPTLMRAYPPPTSRPVTTYWASSLATTASRTRSALLVQRDGTRRHRGRHHRVGLAVLPLHDDRARAHATAAVVELDAVRVERGGGRPARQVELGDGVADRLGIGGLGLLGRLLDGPDVGVGAERVPGAEGG